MIDLQNLREIKKLDPKNVYKSTEMLVDQCAYIWELSKTIEFPEIYKSAKDITICGMGGSRYGAYIVQSLYKNDLKVPLLDYGDYHLPGYINGNSLLVLSSYSGDTEEPLNSAQEAIDKKYPLVGLTSGGRALEMSRKYNFSSVVFDTKYNPSGKPRLGMGYMVFGTIGLLAGLGYLNISDEEVKNAIEELKESQDCLKEKAIEAAKELEGFIPVIFSAEFLNGNAHILRNQFNETSKSFSTFEDLPELNHHLMEGLKNPKERKLKVLFLVSDLYSQKLKKRIELTKDVVSKNDINFIEFEAKGDSKLMQMLKVLSFGGYLTFYLAILYGQDPSLIPWVDYFKEQLSKKS